MVFDLQNGKFIRGLFSLSPELRRSSVEIIRKLSFFALAMNIWSCGKPSSTDANSQIQEAPDVANAYQRIGLNTKPYNAIRTSGQVNDSQRYWSGYYWPTYQGGLAFRWQRGGNSQAYRDYLYDIPPFQSYLQLPGADVQRLSPAEKYDVWVSDPSMGLTRSERQKVMSAAREFNDQVPAWFGLCDGWSLASSLEPEPVKIVKAKSDSGPVIDFYPEDIKALMAYYYALAPKYYVTAGGRCDRKTVTKDAQGRIVESECRDINPATFHLALDRYVGDPKQKLIFDISRDEMIWNYPVYSYQIQYSNLRRLVTDSSYLHAASSTQFLVNVSAWVNVIGGIAPTTRVGPQRSFSQKNWTYVLELDGNYNIVGGEWISDQHPDFAWVVQGVGTGNSKVNYQNLAALINAARL